MRKGIFIFISLAIVTYSQIKPPYEATWSRLTKINDNYVVYNFLLWDNINNNIKSPIKIVVREDSLIWVSLAEDGFVHEVIDKFNKAEFIKEEKYFFRIGNYFKFEWFDKKKHIARWTIYYGDDRLLSEYLYIDSVYNTYPIIDFKWDD